MTLDLAVLVFIGSLGLGFCCIGFALYERGRRKGLEDAEQLFQPVVAMLEKIASKEQP